MLSTLPETDRTDASPTVRQVARALAWVIAVIALLNVLYFALSTACPVIRNDGWYFLDVFLRKAIDGNLTAADFFVRRAGSDHSQPLVKLWMLVEWRWFDLDFMPGALLGVAAAAAGATLYLRILAPTRSASHSIRAYLAWAAICALLFSLNGGTASEWTWPLAAQGNLVGLIILLFFIAVWHAHFARRYALLTVATLFLGVSSDDTAVVAVTAAALALLLIHFADHGQRNGSLAKILLVLAGCMVVVRIGYLFVPIVGGEPSPPITQTLADLFTHFRDGGWWMWVIFPLTLPIAHANPFPSLDASSWLAIQIIMGLLVLAAHAWFWLKALRPGHNRATFVAVATMLLAYGWIAGILFGRVSLFGNQYLMEPRYAILYAGQLVALLLMWGGSAARVTPAGRWREVRRYAAMAGCLALLAIQVPLSIHAWRAQPYVLAYYGKLADQITSLAKDPDHPGQCVPELPACQYPVGERRQLTELLSRDQLNVFSPRIQRRYPYLPQPGHAAGSPP